jgi:type IV pilus assembly protein PilQ
MRRVGTLAALTTVALVTGAGSARAAHIETAPAREHRTAAAGAVTALSILPADGRAEVVISMSGPVTAQHFLVESPHRLVLDLTGARLLPLERAYDRRVRAGITNIRLSQYRTDVVRVVLDLQAPRAYTVTRDGNDIRVSLPTDERVTAWHSQDTPVVAAADAVSIDRPAVTESVSTGALAAAAEPPPAPGTQPPTLDSVIAPVAPAAVMPAPVALFAQQSQQQRITVTWQDADIRDVIAGFANSTGRTIVVGKSVTGTVTAEIKDQPWDVALKAILESQGLAASEDPSGIITVDSYQNILERQASEPLTTQMVNINYVSAASLVETVKGLLSKDCPQTPPPASGNQPPGQSWCLIRGTVAADSGTNSLLITEVTSRLPGLMNYVRQLDVRTPQVQLKAKIISVSRTQLEQLGVSYDLGSAASYFNSLLPRNRPGQETVDDREGRVTLGGDVLAGVGNPLRKYRNGSALNLLFSTALGKYSLTAFLDALREQQLSDIQAEPSITTLDNREARLLVGQETPVRVIDAGSLGQIGTPVRANVQFKETGIILTVTPHITSNRQIRMAIQAEQSELRIVGGDLGFNIDKRNATTQLLVGDGETAVIGGLTQTQIVKNKSGIPLLSDLPLLGRLFSQTDTREDKRDLLILITPHIIDPGEAVRPPGNGSK